MPILTSALEKSELDRDTLATTLGVQPWEVSEWLRSDDVPDEFLPKVQELVGIDLAAAKEAEKKKVEEKKRKTSGQKKRRTSGRRSGVSAEVSQAIALTAKLAYADDVNQAVLAAVAQVELDGDEESLAGLAEATLAINKTTKEAVETLGDLSQIDNPLKFGLELGKLDRRALGEVFRVASAVVGEKESDLPSGDDAPLVVAERVGVLVQGHADAFEWLTAVVTK